MKQQYDRTSAGWHDTLLQLIRRAATELPSDVVAALEHARDADAESDNARDVLRVILNNAALAAANGTPLCQDTGTLTFWIETPDNLQHEMIRTFIKEAVASATKQNYLRHNTIDTLGGKSITSNVAPGAPQIELTTTPARETTTIQLLLKGGGCENVSTQYSLPQSELQAGRDLAGVRAVVLHAIWCAQGRGCAPGILGVAIGGDRAGGYRHAKRQLLRPLADHSPDPALAALEQQLLHEANTLGIGPMGLGGKATLLGIKLGAISRLPASYFVSLSYSCWACRRHAVEVEQDGSIRRWLS